MLEQSLHSSFGLSLLDRRGDDRRGDDRRGPARLPGTVCASSVRTFDPVHALRIAPMGVTRDASDGPGAATRQNEA
jgi:hypothetical protein